MRAKKLCAITVFVIVPIIMVPVIRNYAGNTDPVTPPGGTSSYTLEDIYQRLNDGTPGAQGTFREPAGGPGSTMHTLNEIMAKAPSADMIDGALPGNVLVDRTYWSLRNDGTWGHQVGTMPAETIENTTVIQGAGYYGAFDLSTEDPDLVAGNIVKGKDIYGVIGTYPLAPVAKTGQTGCADPTGNRIPCAGTGQDGDLQKGVPWPNPRFTDHGDGTVTDNLTGLMWTKDGNHGEKVWQAALEYCNGYSLGGYDDWRLPNVKELFSLIDFGEHAPALPDNHPFVFDFGQFWGYWTSTTMWFTIFEDNAYVVEISTGSVGWANDKSETWYVWPVRGGM
jgi:hypothetical protein